MSEEGKRLYYQLRAFGEGLYVEYIYIYLLVDARKWYEITIEFKIYIYRNFYKTQNLTDVFKQIII